MCDRVYDRLFMDYLSTGGQSPVLSFVFPDNDNGTVHLEGIDPGH